MCIRGRITPSSENDATGLLQKKTAYLNKPFFIIRLAVYFLIWSWLGNFFLSKSTEQDLTGDESLTLKMPGRQRPRHSHLRIDHDLLRV